MTRNPATRTPARVSIRAVTRTRRPRAARRRPPTPRPRCRARPRLTRSSVVSSSEAIAASGSMSSPEQHGLVGRVARDRVGVLERQHAAAGGVGAGALELLLRAARSRAGRRRSRACSGRPRRTCRTRARPTAGGSARRRRCGRPSRPSRRARAARGSRRTGASPSSRPAASSRSPARRAARGRAGRSAGGRRCAGATGWSRAPRPASAAGTPARARSRRSAQMSGKRPNVSASARVVGHVLEVADQEGAAARARPLARAEGDDRVAREGLDVLRPGRAPGRPSGWSPNAARSIRCSATTDGWSFARAISCTTTPRSRSSSPASIFGRPTKSVSRSIACGTTSARQVRWKATMSCEV